MVRSFFFFVSNSNIPHGNQCTGMTKKTLKEYDIMITLVMKVSKSLTKSMCPNILFDSTSLRSSLEDFPEGIYFNVSAFSGRENIFVRVDPNCVSEIPLNCPYTRVIKVKRTTFVHLILENRNPI